MNQYSPVQWVPIALGYVKDDSENYSEPQPHDRLGEHRSWNDTNGPVCNLEMEEFKGVVNRYIVSSMSQRT